jgi:hypothetical protein
MKRIYLTALLLCAPFATVAVPPGSSPSMAAGVAMLEAKVAEWQRD